MLLRQTVHVSISLLLSVGATTILLLLDVREILTKRPHILISLVNEVIIIEAVCNGSLFIAIPEGSFIILCCHLIFSACRCGCLRLKVGLETVALSAVVALQILLLEHLLLRGLLL